MKKFIPLIISFSFIALLVSNNALSNWRSKRMYTIYETIDEPIREIISRNDFLADEKEANILVINLWATWCQPCQYEIPHLNKLVDKYENDQVLFLAINAEEENKVIEWMDLQKHECTYFQLHNQKPLINYLFQLNPDEQYKVGQKPEHLPTNIIIKDNELVYFKAGYSKESIEALDQALSATILE